MVTTMYNLIKVNKLFSFFSPRCFLKEIKEMYSVFLSSYRNTLESLGELEKAVEMLACSSCSHTILVLPNYSCSPKLPLMSLQLDRNTLHVFYFLIYINTKGKKCVSTYNFIPRFLCIEEEIIDFAIIVTM